MSIPQAMLPKHGQSAAPPKLPRVAPDPKTPMDKLEKRLKDDGGKGKIDGLLNQQEVDELFGAKAAKNFGKGDVNDKKTGAKKDGLVNRAELNKILDVKV
jgi:hypothetical protein